ncbi:MAG: helix-turn-helix transcriptional regulator [Methanobacteriota archaeon]|nr:MAG: helix-turn-helix transcriptional regulator [Euryarchaeota archaeon]
MTPEDKTRTVSRLLADDYSQKILAYTYSSPVSAQKLSRMCRIPIAACYRRIHELEQAGLIIVDREKEVYKGRRVRLYRCKLRSAMIRFSKGRFVLKYDVWPDNGNGGSDDPPDRQTIPDSSA